MFDSGVMVLQLHSHKEAEIVKQTEDVVIIFLLDMPITNIICILLENRKLVYVPIVHVLYQYDMRCVWVLIC